MSSVDRRSRVEQQSGTGPLPMPGFVAPTSLPEQMSFSQSVPSTDALPVSAVPPASTPVTGTLQSDSALPAVTRALGNDTMSPNVTRTLQNDVMSPNMTRYLPETRTSSLGTTTSARQPIVISGTNSVKKVPLHQRRPPTGRRLVVHATVTALLAFVVLGALFSVVPASEGHGGFSLFAPIFNIVHTQSSNTGLISAQAATATVVTQDGRDIGTDSNTLAGAGLPTPPPNIASAGYDHFTYGQCTYWAAMRYQALTGYWVPWMGNANQWVAGAYNYGWTVSTVPHLHAIIVLMGGVQGASTMYGHVAVVEQIQGNGYVLTSNWNWNGYWAATTYVQFHAGPGVYFVYAPGT